MIRPPNIAPLNEWRRHRADVSDHVAAVSTLMLATLGDSTDQARAARTLQHSTLRFESICYANRFVL